MYVSPHADTPVRTTVKASTVFGYVMMRSTSGTCTRSRASTRGIEPDGRRAWRWSTRTSVAGKTVIIATHDRDRKSTRLNSSHGYISYAVFCLKKKKRENIQIDNQSNV